LGRKEEAGGRKKGGRATSKAGNERRGRGKRGADCGGEAAAERTKRPKAIRGNGVERLRRAAERRAARNSEELADLLLDKALKGRLESARMLVTLAEQKKPRKEPKKEEEEESGHSMADLLAAEPEWVEPEVGDLWTGNGWLNVRTGKIVDRGGAVQEEDDVIGETRVRVAALREELRMLRLGRGSEEDSEPASEQVSEPAN
jgi:hypothetical protein